MRLCVKIFMISLKKIKIKKASAVALQCTVDMGGNRSHIYKGGKMITLKVKIYWDEEGHQWVAEGRNFDGFIITHETLEGIIEYTKIAVPDFVEIPSVKIQISVKRNYYVGSF